MLPPWTAAAAAKAKLTALLAASLAAGSVGGAVVLSHVAPTTQVVSQTAASSDVPQDDPDVVDPETADATDPETVEAGDPETVDAGGDYTLPDCPADAENHGTYVSSVAHDAPKAPGGMHGHLVAEAAQSDCGKHAADASDPETSDSADPESSDADSPDDTASDSDTTGHGHGGQGHGQGGEHGHHGHHSG